MTSTPSDRPVSQSLEEAAADSNPSRAVWIHADESCLGNQFQDRASPGGAAGLVEVWTGEVWERRDYWISEPGTTNNRMALRSAIEGLSALRYPCVVRFVSDSQYLVKGMSEWIHGWKRRGWKRKGGAIENVELWKELDRVAARHEVRWEWVRGHAGHPRNEYANDLAVRAAREQDASKGLVPSGFEEWLERQREEKGRYLDEFEFTPPKA
jgi:ribonuclease HI